MTPLVGQSWGTLSAVSLSHWACGCKTMGCMCNTTVKLAKKPMTKGEFRFNCDLKLCCVFAPQYAIVDYTYSLF